MESKIPTRLSVLGHAQRLAVFRLLMRRYPDRVPASELARALEVKPNTLSAYVNALMQVGLITQTRVGTSLLYSIAMDAVRDTFDHLLLDSCRGRADVLPVGVKAADLDEKPDLTEAYNVLFICTGNSARSIFAEALLRDLAGDRFAAYSAGTQARSELNPYAVAVLRQKGHDVSALRAKTISEFQAADAPRFDFVFTVCDAAANEECPAWQGQPITAHWGMTDPVQTQGSDAEKSLAFQQTYGALRHRIQAFTALSPVALDRLSLQAAVDDIGQSKETL